MTINDVERKINELLESSSISDKEYDEFHKLITMWFKELRETIVGVTE